MTIFKMGVNMGRLILGEMSLRWCGNCDLPIVGQRKCSLCHGTTFKVTHTPPGDIRPAFSNDIDRIKEVIESQFGPAAAEILIQKGSLVVLNSVPSLDRMDEVILHGRVLGNLKYKLLTGRYFFIPQDYGMSLLGKTPIKNVIVVDDGAIPFIEKGASCLVPGITKIIGEFVVDDEVLVCDKHGDILMSGAAQMTSAEMVREKRGVAVKSRRRSSGKEYSVFNPEIEPSWELAVDANAEMLRAKVNKAGKFIRQVIESTDLPMAVSYSGGKDSLATLLLVLDAGYKPDLLFINTGLELPETIQNVHDVAEKYSLEIITFDAGDAFYRALEYFGPPAKDFRWCCKICKLGPATRLIREKYPNGLLSFIGQRQYESMQRKKKGDKWINPWVPNQKGFSPIQKWNALTVWLYIFREKGPYNPWYERGPGRIGCWLCPASSVADLERIRDGYEGSHTFFDYLNRWAEEKGFSSRWVDLGLWRWRNYPGSVRQLLKGRESISSELFPGTTDDFLMSKKLMTFTVKSGIRESTDGNDLVEGRFNRKISLEEVTRLAPILGRIVTSNNEELIIEDRSGGLIRIYESNFTVEGEERGINTNVKDVISVLKRAIHCVGCGVCLGRCPVDALGLDKSPLVQCDTPVGDMKNEVLLHPNRISDSMSGTPVEGAATPDRCCVTKCAASGVSLLEKPSPIGSGGKFGEPTGSPLLEKIDAREKVRVDTALCIMCRKCLGPCPVENFGAGEEYRFSGLTH